MLRYKYRGQGRQPYYIGELNKEPSHFIIMTIELIDRYSEKVVISVSEYGPMNIFHADIDRLIIL